MGWVAIGISVFALAVAGLSYRLSHRQWKSQRERQRLLGDVDEIRAAIVAARRRFMDIMNAGGRSSDYFLADENRETAERLMDAADRADDDLLSNEMREAAGAWTDAWACASPPPRDSTGKVITTDEIGTHKKQRNERQGDRADSGFWSCESALARLNVLDRTL